MTVIEAARALAEGKQVRRPRWQSYVRLRRGVTELAAAEHSIWLSLWAGEDHWMPSTGDLIADDYEIVEGGQPFR